MKNPSFAVIALLSIMAPSFGQTIMFSSPIQAAVCGPGDLNGDGIPDLVIETGGCVQALSGLDFSVLWQTCASFAASVAKTGDLDGDGISEIVVAGASTVILSGATGGIFRTIPVATTSVDGGGDFDGDGVPDQLGTTASGVQVFAGVSGAPFVIYPAFLTFSAAFLKDINHDGFDEVAVAHDNSPLSSCTQGGVTVLRGPNGAVHAQIVSQVFGFCARNVADIGDVTGDGKHDLAVSGGQGLSVYNVAPGGTILAGSGSVWTAPLLSGWVGPAATVGDVDGDGRPDMVVTNATLGFGFPPAPPPPIAGTCLVSGAAGALLFVLTGGLAGNAPSPSGPVCALGDLNGDGAPDVARSYYLVGPPAQFRLDVVSCVPLATAPVSVDLGGGCGGLSTTLTCGALRLGNPWAFTIGPALPSSYAYVVLDVGAPVPTPFGSCTVFLDLGHFSSWLSFPMPIGAAGSGAVTIAVPQVPTAAGVTVVAQAVVYGTPSSLGFDLTNAMRATAGF